MSKIRTVGEGVPDRATWRRIYICRTSIQHNSGKTRKIILADKDDVP